MKIGFTYDLKDDYIKAGYSLDEVAEFDSIITTNAIIKAISDNGHTPDPIGNWQSLTSRLIKGDRWDMVFNICEGLYGSGRESLVPAILDMYQIPYTFSSPAVHAITLDKGITKIILKHNGIPTTDFTVIKNAESIAEQAFPYPYFIKPISEGTGKGVTPESIVHNFDEFRKNTIDLLKKFNQSVIVEPYLEGREVTVGIIGNGDDAYPIGVMEISFTKLSDSNLHSYFNKANCEKAAIYSNISCEFAKRCSDIAIATHKALHIQDLSRVDIRADIDGNPYVLEVNSLPGLMPERSDLVLLAEKAGKNYEWLMNNIINTSIKRVF